MDMPSFCRPGFVFRSAAPFLYTRSVSSNTLLRQGCIHLSWGIFPHLRPTCRFSFTYPGKVFSHYRIVKPRLIMARPMKFSNSLMLPGQSFQQSFPGLGRNALYAPAIVPVELPYYVQRQVINIFLSFPGGGILRGNIKAVIQVLPEPSLLHGLLQVNIGSGYYAHVHRYGICPPTRLFLSLESPLKALPDNRIYFLFHQGIWRRRWPPNSPFAALRPGEGS